MPGKALPSFADFVTATNEKVIAPPKDIVSDAVKHTYAYRDMLRDRSEGEVVKSGSQLTDRVQLISGSQFGFYDVNEPFSPYIEDVLTKVTIQWRFCKDVWGWTDQEVELNEGDTFTQFKELRDSKRQACTVSIYNGMEDALWATPNAATMETTGSGGRPYSIRAIITEDGMAPAGFTTLMTVNPATSPRWRNQTQNFAFASIDTTLIPAFEAMWRKVKFEAPDSKEQYFKETKFNRLKIYTNGDGRDTYVRLTRNANDRAMVGSSPDVGFAVADPMFSGIPVKYVEALDDANYTLGQPRFFFLNYQFLFPIFHQKRWMRETDPIHGGQQQPFSWVVFKDCWYNLFCRSRWRQGILVPV